MKRNLIVTVIFALLSATLLTMTSCSSGVNSGAENVTSVTEDFSAIEILADATDITVLPSSDGECRVASKSHKKISYTATVDGGVLAVRECDDRAWIERVIGSSDSSLTVYLPQSEYSSLLIDESTGDVRIDGDFHFGTLDVNLTTGDAALDGIDADTLNVNVTTGDISLSDITCSGNAAVNTTTGDISLAGITCSGDVNIDTTTGDVTLSDVNCNTFTSNGTSSSIDMRDVIASGRMDINTTTGDVIFERCDASEVVINTTTGDVKGSFLSDKIIFTDSSTGDIEVPKLTEGGRCDVETSTGDIEIEIK